MRKSGVQPSRMNERGILNFRILGIPVSIHPVSWLMLLILGGGLGVDSGQQLACVLLFVIAAMLCLLVHELGHALAGRQISGQVPCINISMLGGSTYTPGLPRARGSYFFYVFAGPLASLLLGVAGGALFGLQIGDLFGGVSFALLTPLGIMPDTETLLALESSGMGRMLYIFYLQLFRVSVWWTIFNLLPIYPLDGGQMLGTLLNNVRVACMIGLVFGGLLCLCCLLMALLGGGSWFNVLITGYLTYINYNCLRQL